MQSDLSQVTPRHRAFIVVQEHSMPQVSPFRFSDERGYGVLSVGRRKLNDLNRDTEKPDYLSGLRNIVKKGQDLRILPYQTKYTSLQDILFVFPIS